MPRPYFYKLVLSSTIQAKQLLTSTKILWINDEQIEHATYRIPDNFVRKIRDELSAVATLAVPVGHVWHVGLRKADNKFWFREGWREFVDHYAIRVGYFLLFKYEGNSSFVVYIFNLSTSEINYQSTNLSNSQAFKYCNQNAVFEEIEDDDSGDIVGSSLQSLTSERNKPLSEGSDQLRSYKICSPPALQNLFNGSKLNCINWSNEGSVYPAKGGRNLTTDFQYIRNSGVLISHSESKKTADSVKQEMMDEDVQNLKNVGRKKRKMDGNEQGPSTQNKEEVEMRYTFYKSASARKRTVTAEERERVVSASNAFEPMNPFCRVVLRPSYLYRGCIMYLPSCFAEKNLSRVSGFVKLQISDGRQWPVRCLNKGGKIKFSQGWYEFCLENNLGEGDVCVFELINAREIVLKVTMFRVMEDARCANPTPLQSYSHNKLLRH